MKRVLCNAVVDSLGLDDGGQHHGWRVVVTGTGDHSGQSRVYEIREETQDDAAMEGIRRFVEEHGGDQ